MIAESPVGLAAVACPEGKSVSPVEYVDSALANEIPLFDNELVAVRLRLTPLTNQAPPVATFTAAWPTRVVDPSPTCAFLLADDTNASLEWAPNGEGGASFTVTDPSSVEPVTIEVWMRAADPETGATFSSSLRSDSANVSVDLLGGRMRVDRRSDSESPDVSFPPVINVWYGDAQPFGRAGRAQQWVNVVGRATDHDGISSLTYSLNGGPEVDLALGPDPFRLAREGDFNIQIGYDDLATGPNQIVITAIDQADFVATAEVTLLVSANSSPALPVEIEFDPNRSILEQAAVVDGPWFINTDGSVTTDALAYDRIVAIGDTSWQDYELNLTVSVHSLGAEYDTPQSGNLASVGLAMRWMGHTQRSDEDPYIDYFPVGALIVHQWSSDEGWRMVGNRNSPSANFASTPEFDTTYRWRAQVQSIGDGTTYRFKSWPLEAAEPPTWDMEIVDDDSPTSGSVALVAHHVDADFGPVTITPLS